MELPWLQAVAAVRSLGQGHTNSWKEAARLAPEWYPTRDLAISQIKDTKTNPMEELRKGIMLVEKERESGR